MMSPAEFRDCVAALRWSLRGLAEALGCDDSLVRRWARGSAEIPPPVAAWLRTLAAHHRAHPPPTWRRRPEIIAPSTAG